MKSISYKSIITCIIMLFFSNLYSQNDFVKLTEDKNNCPIIIINENIISNMSLINQNKGLVTQMSVMKDKPNREQHTFYNLSENGVVLVDLDKKVITKTQCELNRFFGLGKKNKVYVNGYLIENSKYEIAEESIVKIELIMPDSINKLKNKSINVWTITEEERVEGCQK